MTRIKWWTGSIWMRSKNLPKHSNSGGCRWDWLRLKLVRHSRWLRDRPIVKVPFAGNVLKCTTTLLSDHNSNALHLRYTPFSSQLERISISSYPILLVGQGFENVLKLVAIWRTWNSAIFWVLFCIDSELIKSLWDQLRAAIQFETVNSESLLNACKDECVCASNKKFACDYRNAILEWFKKVMAVML